MLGTFTDRRLSGPRGHCTSRDFSWACARSFAAASPPGWRSTSSSEPATSSSTRASTPGGWSTGAARSETSSRSFRSPPGRRSRSIFVVGVHLQVGAPRVLHGGARRRPDVALARDPWMGRGEAGAPLRRQPLDRVPRRAGHVQLRGLRATGADLASLPPAAPVAQVQAARRMVLVPAVDPGARHHRPAAPRDRRRPPRALARGRLGLLGQGPGERQRGKAPGDGRRRARRRDRPRAPAPRQAPSPAVRLGLPDPLCGRPDLARACQRDRHPEDGPVPARGASAT